MDKLNITLFSIYDEKNSPISKIIEGLFLGCEVVSKNIELLEKNNIKKIIKIGTDLKIHFPKKFEYLSINIHDHPDENIIDYFEACYNFIDQSLINNQNVLVHCFKGISRSASVICAFLIKKFKWNFNESIRFIESKRPWISINDGFDKQLQEYDLKNNSKVFAKNNYRKRTNYYLPIIKPYILRKRSNYKLLSLGGKIIKKNVYLHKKVNLKQQYLDEKILYLKRLISQSHLEHCDKPKEIQKNFYSI